MIPRASDTLLAELLRVRYLYVYPGDFYHGPFTRTACAYKIWRRDEL